MCYGGYAPMIGAKGKEAIEIMELEYIKEKKHCPEQKILLASVRVL